LSQSRRIVADIQPGSLPSDPAEFTDVNGTVYFSAASSTTTGSGKKKKTVNHGVELWKTNGTAAGTVLVKDINPGNYSSLVDNMLDASGVLYFNAYDRLNNGMGVWRSDGTEAGTVMLMNTAPGSPTTASYPLWHHNGAVYFIAFASLILQIPGLFGPEGIAPAREFLRQARSSGW